MTDTWKDEIRMADLIQTWHNRVVLDIPELKFLPGKHYALIGANGSGKSTLLQLLAGRLSADDGHVGFLPQKPYAFALSVSRNIQLGIPSAVHPSESEKRSLINKQLASLDLTKLAAAKGNRLSGGEAQRMALARILVVPRSILLLDEPTNALDLNSLTRAESALSEYLAANDCLLVLATHQISLARRLCDELIYLDQGHLRAMGSISHLLDPRQLAKNPDSRLSLFMRYEQGSSLSDADFEGSAGAC